MNGWIKLHRKIVNWEWFSDPHTFHLFMYLLIHACQKEKKWMGVVVKRGQVITGRKSMAKTLGMSEQNIRTSMARLKSTNEITIYPTNRFSLITLVNFEKYQDHEPEPTSNSTNKPPTTNQQLTTSKEYKNIKKKEVKEETHPLVLFIRENYPMISQIKRQLTNQEAVKLKDQYSSGQIKKVLDSMENYKGITKYNSVYLTALKWLAKDFPPTTKSATTSIDYDNEDAIPFKVPQTEKYRDEYYGT